MPEQFNVAYPVNLAVTTEQSATCKYSTDPANQSFEEMIDFATVTGGGKYHSSSLGKLVSKSEKYTYYVRCKDDFGNSAEKTIEFVVTPVVITETTATSFSEDKLVKLSVTTDVKAGCRYNNDDDDDYDTMTGVDFTSPDGKTHSVELTLSGTKIYNYFVRCKTIPGNEESPIGTKITFTVNAVASVLPERTQLLAVSSEEIINAALQNVGNFFIGTALAATGTAGTTGTTGSTINNSDNKDEDFLEEGKIEEGEGLGAFSSKLTNLKPGTFFYARAYAVSNGTTYYGNQVGFRTADSCFVATAAYGSIFHPSVQILRNFRDQFLRSNAVSRALIDLYYAYSPMLADLISQHSSLRLVVRMLLLPVIGTAWIVLHFGASIVLLPAVVFGLMLCLQGLRLLNRKAAAV